MRVASILSCATLVAGAVIPGGGRVDERGASGTIEKRASGTATVDLAVTQGTPQSLGDGFIYGFPDNADGSANTAIPSNLRAGSGFNYCRAGGAQLPSPSLGYASGQLQVRGLPSLDNTDY